MSARLPRDKKMYREVMCLLLDQPLNSKLTNDDLENKCIEYGYFEKG